MDKSELLIKDWKELIHCMEMDLQARDEIIAAQKEQICCLEEQVAILEEQKKRITDAGNENLRQCEKLEKLCISQQELLDDFRTMFSDLLEKT